MKNIMGGLSLVTRPTEIKNFRHPTGGVIPWDETYHPTYYVWNTGPIKTSTGISDLQTILIDVSSLADYDEIKITTNGNNDKAIYSFVTQTMSEVLALPANFGTLSGSTNYAELSGFLTEYILTKNPGENTLAFYLGQASFEPVISVEILLGEYPFPDPTSIANANGQYYVVYYDIGEGEGGLRLITFDSISTNASVTGSFNVINNVKRYDTITDGKWVLTRTYSVGSAVGIGPNAYSDDYPLGLFVSSIEIPLLTGGICFPLTLY